MFWKFNLINTSHVETLLAKENVTLRELMDEDDILQECKAQTKKLVDFLVQPEIMDEMVTLITQEPSYELDEVVRYKYSNIACELLTSDVGAINDALAGDQALLGKLLGFLERKEQPPTALNPLLASFFSKTVSLLISRKTQPMFEFLHGKDDFVPCLLEHLETSAITDLLLRLVTCTENNDSRSALVKWLSEQRLVERLVSLISPEQSGDRNSNAAQALCDIVRVSREHMSMLQEKADLDPLLKVIESTETISQLLENMFGSEKKESVLVSGILVILALLEFKKQGPAGQYQTSGSGGSAGNNQSLGGQGEGNLAESPLHCFASLFFRSEGPELMTSLDAERLSQGVAQVIAALTPRLGDFTQLLREPPQKPSYSSLMTQPPVEQPVGWTRLEVAHLLSALLNTNTHDLNDKLATYDTIPCLLELFFRHSWNNFLHTQVEQAIGTILRSPPTSDQEGNKVHPLLDQLFCQCKIVQRLLDNWEENDQEQSQPGKHRRGYMGHLTNIANHMVRNTEGGPNAELIQAKLNDLPEDYNKRWEAFVTETLAEINKRNQTPLVSGVPSSVLDGDCVDFRDLHVPFQQESALQQAFSDYQMQQMTSNFVDQFGFNDDEFVETDESITDRLTRVTGSFQLDAEESMRSAELFEQTCRERIPSLGDNDSDEEVWDDKEHEITFASGINASGNLGRLTSQCSSSLDESSSDSEGEESPSTSSRRVGNMTPDSPGTVVSVEATSQEPLDRITTSSPSRLTQNDDLKMEVDTGDPWSASFATSEGVAMDTSSPWEGSSIPAVAVEPVAPTLTASMEMSKTSPNPVPEEQGWADFSSFSPFTSSKNFSVPSPVAMDTSKDNFKTEEEDSFTTNQTKTPPKIEATSSLPPSLNSPPLANGQVPVMAPGPVMVVVGSPVRHPVVAPAPTPDLALVLPQQQQPLEEASPPQSPLPLSPATTEIGNKVSQDVIIATIAKTQQATGSLESGCAIQSVTEAAVAPSSPTATAACLQNGPV